MLKFLFELITDPLGLPLPWYWDLLCMTAIGAVAFAIGWAISPGGELGSLIHWVVRAIAFIALWAIVYGIIVAAQWIIANWVFVLCAVLFIVAVIAAVHIVRRNKKETGSNGGEI